MKLFLLCILTSLLHLSHSEDGIFECPEGYDDVYEDGAMYCYTVFGADTGGVSYKNAECRGGTSLPIPIGTTPKFRIENFVRKKFMDMTLTFSFPGIWLGFKPVKHPNQVECFEASHNPTFCYQEQHFHWKFDGEKIAGSGDCMHMILNEPSDWYGPKWKRERCDVKMPFVCEAEPCPKGSFRCIKDGEMSECMQKDVAICNGKEDCDDGADEDHCPGAPQDCGGTITQSKGSLISPNFPGRYGPYESCRWTIKAEVNQRISIKIAFIDLEQHEGDNLAIIDGEADSNAILKLIKGKIPTDHKLPKVPLSTSNIVTILFRTDGNGQELGFNLTYEAVSPVTHNLTASATRQYLTSPNYPDDYDRESEYLITAPTGSVITLQFNDFKLAPDDRVIVRDGMNRSSPIIHIFRGYEPPSTVSVSYGNAMLVSLEIQDADFDDGKRFNASFVEGCQADIKTDSVELESPGRNSYSKYPKNLQCRYNVTPPQPGHSLSVSFEEDFRTEPDDKVEVYCGKVTSPSMVLNGSKQHSPLHTLVIQNCSSVSINFTSDGSGEFQGWRAKISHDCPALPILPATMKRNTEQVYVNVKVIYSCTDEGYEVVGVNPQICGLNRKWQSQVPNCTLKYCGHPKDISQGYFYFISHKLTYGGEVEYHCHPRYNLVDPAKRRRKCVKSGWEEPLPECKETFCRDLSESIENSPKLSVSDTKGRRVGDSVKFKCEKGYRFKTNHQSLIFCEEDGDEEFGKWSSIPECEKIQCDTNYIAVEFGVVSQRGSIDVGNEVSVVCHSGFEVLSGNGTAVCKENGEFDTRIFICQE